MPHLLTHQRYLAAVTEAADRLGSALDGSWPGAAVPTCPGWSMLDLIAHTGMVHRWARSAIAGDRAAMGEADLVEEEGRTSPDPFVWLRVGAAALVADLDAAAEDLEAWTFLADPPAPRLFWARRQCHETTIHALDGIAAHHGRQPTARDAWFDTELAVDGIDELLVGFWTRPKSGPRSSTPYAAVIRATDADAAWLIEVGPDRAVTTRGAGGIEADHLVEGSAIDLYLALWNRGGEVRDEGGLLDRWRREAAITWH